MRPSRPWIALSVAAGTLTAITSVAGIAVRGTYARELPAWAIQAVGQDLANLLVVVLLLASAALARKGSWPATLVWLGCLIYLVYAFAIYAFSAHFNRWFLAYVAILGLSFWAIAGTLTSRDTVEAAAAPLRDHPQRRGAGALLIAVGVLFALLWLSEIVPHVLANSVPPNLAETGLLTNPVHVLDLAFVLPAMILTGVLARRRNSWGLVLLVPLLVFAVTMGIGILVLFALSATRGLPTSAPAAVIVALIVVLSVAYAGLLLWTRRRARPEGAVAPEPPRTGARS